MSTRPTAKRHLLGLQQPPLALTLGERSVGAHDTLPRNRRVRARRQHRSRAPRCARADVAVRRDVAGRYRADAGEDRRLVEAHPAPTVRELHAAETGRAAIRRIPRRPLTRHTKIVATIGPASRDPETLVRMVEAGMDVARLNFSHGDPSSMPRPRSACARRPVAPAAPSRSSRTRRARRCASVRWSARSPSSAARARHVPVWRGRRGRGERMSVGAPRACPRDVRRRRDVPRRRRDPPARQGHPRRRPGDRRGRRGRRGRRIASGPERAGPARADRVGARGGSRAPAGGREDRRRPRRAVVRAQPAGRRSSCASTRACR